MLPSRRMRDVAGGVLAVLVAAGAVAGAARAQGEIPVDTRTETRASPPKPARPVVKRTMSKPSVAPKPVAAKSVAPKPIVPKPVAAKPVAAKPAAPALAKPVAMESIPAVASARMAADPAGKVAKQTITKQTMAQPSIAKANTVKTAPTIADLARGDTPAGTPKSGLTLADAARLDVVTTGALAGAPAPASNPAANVTAQNGTPGVGTSGIGTPAAGVGTTGALPAATPVGKATGLPVPRYASLKTDRVNLREGPSKDNRTAWVFQRAGLPVEIVAEYETWRRIRDAEGTEGWVLHSLLSGRRTALVTPWVKGGVDPLPLYAKADDHSDVIAQLQTNVIASIKGCSASWCRIIVAQPGGGDLTGYMRQDRLWGVYPNEKVE